MGVFEHPEHRWIDATASGSPLIGVPNIGVWVITIIDQYLFISISLISLTVQERHHPAYLVPVVNVARHNMTRMISDSGYELINWLINVQYTAIIIIIIIIIIIHTCNFVRFLANVNVLRYVCYML